MPEIEPPASRQAFHHSALSPAYENEIINSVLEGRECLIGNLFGKMFDSTN